MTIHKAEAATGGVLYKKGVLKNFTKFTGKHLYQSLFFTKVADLGLHEFYEISINNFFTEHLRATASDKVTHIIEIIDNLTHVNSFVTVTFL